MALQKCLDVCTTTFARANPLPAGHLALLLAKKHLSRVLIGLRRDQERGDEDCAIEEEDTNKKSMHNVLNVNSRYYNAL
jgi:hypothetical protein